MKLKKIGVLISFFLLTLSISGFAESDVYISDISSFMFMMVFKLIIYIVIFIGITLLALYGTKFIAKNFSGVIDSRYIKVIDNINVSTNFSILIIELNENVYVLGKTTENITLIDKFKSDDFTITNEDYNKERSHKSKIILERINRFVDKEDENEKKY